MLSASPVANSARYPSQSPSTLKSNTCDSPVLSCPSPRGYRYGPPGVHLPPSRRGPSRVRSVACCLWTPSACSAVAVVRQAARRLPTAFLSASSRPSVARSRAPLPCHHNCAVCDGWRVVFRHLSRRPRSAKVHISEQMENNRRATGRMRVGTIG